MPRYFFHTAEDGHDRDVEGVELPDHHAAGGEAIRCGGDLLQDRSPDALWDGSEMRISVMDDREQLLLAVVMLAIDTPLMEEAKD